MRWVAKTFLSSAATLPLRYNFGPIVTHQVNSLPTSSISSIALVHHGWVIIISHGPIERQRNSTDEDSGHGLEPMTLNEAAPWWNSLPLNVFLGYFFSDDTISCCQQWKVWTLHSGGVSIVAAHDSDALVQQLWIKLWVCKCSKFWIKLQHKLQWTTILKSYWPKSKGGTVYQPLQCLTLAFIIHERHNVRSITDISTRPNTVISCYGYDL